MVTHGREGKGKGGGEDGLKRGTFAAPPPPRREGIMDEQEATSAAFPFGLIKGREGKGGGIMIEYFQA